MDIPFRVLHVDDWGGISPFQPEASNRPIFIVARSGVGHAFPVPVFRWARVTPGLRLADGWNQVRLQVRATVGEAEPVNRQVTFSAWSFQAHGAAQLIQGGHNSWDFGKGLDTRGANGVYFVRVLDIDRGQGRVMIENDPSAGRAEDVEVARGWVEASLVYPLLRGRDVSAWSASPSSFIIAPYEPGDLETLLTDRRFLQRFPQAYGWLGRHKAVLSRRRPPPNRAWHLDGADWCRLDGPLRYMQRSHIVVVRELQQRPAAAVVSAQYVDELGRSTAPLIDHKLMFCAVRSQEEALYLAGFINSAPVQDLLASYGNQIAMSPQTMKRLPIPDFSKADELHAALVRHTADLNRADSRSITSDAVDEVVLQIVTPTTTAD